MTQTAVTLMSGGIDSATCTAMACSNYDRVVPVFVRYGQQTEDLEYEMAMRQRAHLSEEFDATIEPMTVLDYTYVFNRFAQGVAHPTKDFGSMVEDDGRSSGYVPMRNLHLIASAGAIADVEDAHAVYHGAQGGDEADYPDCRGPFMEAAENALNESLPGTQEVYLRVPLLNKRKHEVIQEADSLGVAFEYTYSCYSEVDDFSDPEPCNDCPACEERTEAFKQAGIEDPHAP